MNLPDQPSRLIAIYGDVNPNIIDGSSIWLRNLARLCLNVPGARVDIFLKAPLERNYVIGSEISMADNVRIIEPGDSESYEGPGGLRDIVGLIESEDKKNLYSAIILRGLDVSLQAAACATIAGRLWPYLTDIPQRIVDFSPDHQAKLMTVLEASRFLLCQTEEIRNFLGNVIATDFHKFVLVPPLVPENAFSQYEPEAEAVGDRDIVIFYSGKFAPAWATEKLIDICAGKKGLRIIVAGDKFHRVPEDPEFARRLEQKLSSKPGVEWRGALSQDDVFACQKDADVGFAWRHPELDASLELSTKLLEYSASGLAVITNPTPVHVSLLGKDYPFFAVDESQLADLIERLPLMRDQMRTAGALCHAVAKKFSFDQFQPRWNTFFGLVSRCGVGRASGRLKIVLAGHDLKFAQELIGYFRARVDCDFEIDHWKSLRDHDTARSRNLLSWADIVFCEWCAGNSVYYANHIDPATTRLFIRFHRIELLMEFAPKLDIGKVEKVLFVGPHILQQAKNKFDWPPEKLALVPNFVDTAVYDRPKFRGAEFNLGLVGFVPKLKRLDRALDILCILRGIDSRYRLFIKGRFPWEYPWIWNNPEEREHYESCLARIRRDPVLNDAVIFDGFGNDMPLWLRKIGVILSLSDLESFHMALAEGLASGCYPLLWDREAARELFPWIEAFATAEELAQDLLANNSAAARTGFRGELVREYDMKQSFALLDNLIV